MKAVFADTSYYLALLNENDEFHARAARRTEVGRKRRAAGQAWGWPAARYWRCGACCTERANLTSNRE